jgi:hypothetical protein
MTDDRWWQVFCAALTGRSSTVVVHSAEAAALLVRFAQDVANEAARQFGEDEDEGGS